MSKTTSAIDIADLINSATKAVANAVHNLVIKLDGGYTDNEYAVALEREHRIAVQRQGLNRKATK